MVAPVLYGIAIGVIRLIPIAIRIGGKIVGISYRILAKPQHLKHAQKIFGKNNVVQHGSADKIIQQIARHNTKTQKLSPISVDKFLSILKAFKISLSKTQPIYEIHCIE